jgi:predicted Zn-ribbon and HTH transcriptional regulator
MIDKKECLRCGYKWESRIEHPIACPNCKRYDWDLKVDQESLVKKLNTTEVK